MFLTISIIRLRSLFVNLGMRKFFLFILPLSLLLFSCDETNQTKDYIDCERLHLDVAYNHFYETDRDQPYTGVCKLFHVGGKLKQMREMENGKNHGRFELYNEQGILVEEGAFHENLHHGVFKYYNDEGELIEQIEYAYGRRK